jgi:hypothetical protein
MSQFSMGPNSGTTIPILPRKSSKKRSFRPRPSQQKRSLTQKCRTYDHEIRLFIDIPFFHLIFRLKSKFVFLVDRGMYPPQSPKIFTNFMEIFKSL